MTPTLIAALLGLLGLDAADSAPQEGEQVVRRVVIRDEVILRVPVRRRPSHQIEWTERKGPKCISAKLLAGATLSGHGAIDFVLNDRTRLRAHLDRDCPALDFYGGFYLQPEDGRICAKREEIRSRMGGSCQIERFRALRPRLQR